MPNSIPTQTTAAKLLPVQAVMAQLNVGRSTVFELLGTGQLVSVKIGRRRLVPQAAIDNLVASLIQSSGGGDAAA